LSLSELDVKALAISGAGLFLAPIKEGSNCSLLVVEKSTPK